MNPLALGHHFFDAAGVRLSYLVRGSAPRTVLYLTPRGNGDSSAPPDPSTMTAAAMADDLDHLRAHLGLDRFPLLAGHSHGGAVALRYAQRHPRRVERLLLLSPQVMDAAPGLFKEMMARRGDDPTYMAAAKVLMEVAGAGGPRDDAHFREMLDRTMVWWFADAAKADGLRRDMAGPLTSANPARAYAWRTNRNDGLEENKLPHIRDAGLVEAETLIVQGEEDSVCSTAGAQAVADGIKGSKIVVLPGLGHFPWIEGPDEFWRAAEGFVKSDS
ncbi:proline iminopeptidase [Colletotrichum karsti]|uniref:Proline iminopeptidase n=1 Tax=Colletotrichum karsti TaxID=1095194 RepID=A0A9P6LDS3_9PEZI|nr:proline iminopeptidase [Colletotrichum karsti]KAF9872264.1 proline iminopeptidase [Colletotrichum karsti]